MEGGGAKEAKGIDLWSHCRAPQQGLKRVCVCMKSHLVSRCLFPGLRLKEEIKEVGSMSACRDSAPFLFSVSHCQEESGSTFTNRNRRAPLKQRC